MIRGSHRSPLSILIEHDSGTDDSYDGSLLLGGNWNVDE